MGRVSRWGAPTKKIQTSKMPSASKMAGAAPRLAAAKDGSNRQPPTRVSMREKRCAVAFKPI